MKDINNSSLSLIDLISEKHLELRKRLHETNGQPINKSEAHILAILNVQGLLSISELSRLIGMSRQGAHKYIQGLLSAGLVELVQVEGNVRDKHVALTPAGHTSRERFEETKSELERMIAERIGEEQVELLKRLLQEDWLPQ